MNYLDLAIAIPIVIGMAVGFYRGFIKELAGLVGLLSGLYLASEFSGELAGMLRSQLAWSERALMIISFLILFFAVLIVVRLIAFGVKKLVSLSGLGLGDKILGSFFGMLKYTLISSLLIFVLDRVDREYPFLKEEVRSDSLLFDPVLTMTSWLYPRIEKNLEEELTQE